MKPLTAPEPQRATLAHAGRRLAIPALLLLAAPACSGEVRFAGATTASAASTATGAGGTGGAGGAGGMGATGGAPSCEETHEALSVTLNTWQGDTYGCDGQAGDVEVSATLTYGPTTGSIVLDGCSPAAGCEPLLSRLVINVPDTYFEIIPGTYVRVHLAIEPFQGGCRQRIQIKNLPTWDGVPNPVDPGEKLWFLGVDGGSEAFADTPIVAATEALGCSPGEPTGCGAHEDYDWHFRLAADPTDPGVSVPMGKTVYAYAGAQGSSGLLIHNLRSYSAGVCDGPVDLAYWAKYHVPGD